jgi:hypothetical protein
MRTTKSAMAFPDRHAQPPGLQPALELDADDGQHAWADVWRLDDAAAVQAACQDLPAGHDSQYPGMG